MMLSDLLAIFGAATAVVVLAVMAVAPLLLDLPLPRRRSARPSA